MDGGLGAAGCTARLLGRFREYAHFAPHACRDMRYEDIVHGGHGAQERRAYAVHGPRALCVHCACTLHLDLGVQARRLLRELGLPAKLDLMAAMRRISKWHKEHLKPKAHGALAFVSDDPGAHRIFGSQLDKFATPGCRNITKELAQLRVELGGWLLREGYEPGGAAPADFRNELIDSLPPTERDALMGGGGGGGGSGGGRSARPSRCPLFGARRGHLHRPRNPELDARGGQEHADHGTQRVPAPRLEKNTTRRWAQRRGGHSHGRVRRGWRQRVAAKGGGKGWRRPKVAAGVDRCMPPSRQ